MNKSYTKKMFVIELEHDSPELKVLKKLVSIPEWKMKERLNMDHDDFKASFSLSEIVSRGDVEENNCKCIR